MIASNWMIKINPTVQGSAEQKDLQLDSCAHHLNMALAVLDYPDLTKETTLPAYVITTGLLLGILQEWVKIMGHS